MLALSAAHRIEEVLVLVWALGGYRCAPFEWDWGVLVEDSPSERARCCMLLSIDELCIVKRSHTQIDSDVLVFSTWLANESWLCRALASRRLNHWVKKTRVWVDKHRLTKNGVLWVITTQVLERVIEVRPSYAFVITCRLQVIVVFSEGWTRLSHQFLLVKRRLWMEIKLFLRLCAFFTMHGWQWDLGCAHSWCLC